MALQPVLMSCHAERGIARIIVHIGSLLWFNLWGLFMALQLAAALRFLLIPSSH